MSEHDATPLSVILPVLNEQDNPSLSTLVSATRLSRWGAGTK